MKKRIILHLAILFMPLLGFSQNEDIEKRMDKVNTLISKNKVDKAAEKLEDILDDYSTYGAGWDLLSKIRYSQWDRSKKNDSGGQVVVTVEGKDNDEETTKMASDLAEMLNGISPAKIAYNKYINTLRKATLFSNDSYYSSILLRSDRVKVDVDTNLNKKAIMLFNKGEISFQNKNFQEAAENYQKAIDVQPNFYKARLYLGDSYYYKRDYVKAIQKFNEAKEAFPRMLEPRKYLVDAYAKEELYQKCQEEAIATFTIYPDGSMKQKLADIVTINKKTLDIKWTQRKCYPNKIKNNNKFTFSEETIESNEWSAYKAAKGKIKEYCNVQGIIEKKNDVTTLKYLELYSWEELLKNDKSPELDEARKMQELGYLDCYVFVTCFHQDLYDQYLDFSINNSDKIIEYFNTFIK